MSTVKKKFDLVFDTKLEQHFPDWKERINYQKKQEKFYKSTMRKQRETLRFKENFNDTGFYKEQQNSKTKLNIFDTK